MTQKQKADTFRRLHFGSKAFVIPNPWDAGSARLLESLGFQALATTSAGLAFSKGRPDGESNVSREEAIANAKEIVEATSLPAAADLEGGYGPRPEDCALTIRRGGEAGLVGGSIEDSTGDSQSPIYPIEAAVERVKAAVEAARSFDFPFMFTARAENYLHGRADLADTIKRLQAYQEAGADVLFAPGIKTAEDIRAICSSVDRPVNVVMGLMGVPLTVDQLSELGVKRISTGGSLARAALAGLMRAAQEIRNSGTFTYAAQALPHAQMNAFFWGADEVKPPSYRFERQAKARGVSCICGIDEAGRGPLAGPVVAAAVILYPARTPKGIDNSKKLTPDKREKLFIELSACAIFGVGIADVERIDRDNILAATLWAMGEAVRQLKKQPELALVDGNRAPQLPCSVLTIVEGDGLSLSIAAASIIAKVTRDRIMVQLDAATPGYGFARHKGYGTEEHVAALLQLGPSVHHRKSFAPVKELLAR